MESDQESLVFSNDPNDYNQISCLACMAVVKVHHARKHMSSHGLTMKEYKEMYGSEVQYVKKFHHKCGLCQHPMLFDLDTIYNHIFSTHKIKIKEYVEQHLLRPLQPKDQMNSIEEVDQDGAPVMKAASLKRTIDMIDNDDSTQNFISMQSNSNYTSSDFDNNVMSQGLNSSSSLSIVKTQKFSRNIDLPKNTLVSEDSDPTDKMLNCYGDTYIERMQDWDEHGNLISNDFADYTLIECKICHLHVTMTGLRSHTKSHHKITITEYKKEFGVDLVPVKYVYHRCGICEELIVLDSDHVAVHLKKPGHNITHKNYNAGYMVDTRMRKSTIVKSLHQQSQYAEMPIRRVQHLINDTDIKERSKRKPRVSYGELDHVDDDVIFDSSCSTDADGLVQNSSHQGAENGECDEYGQPIVVMENIEHDILEGCHDESQKAKDSSDGIDNKTPIFKSLQLNSSKKLDVVLLDGLESSHDVKTEAEEIILDG